AADSGGGEAPMGDGDDGGATVAGSPMAQLGGDAGGGERVWYLVVNGEQVGPFTAQDVRGRHAAGEVDVETYGWREGFADWLRLGSIEDFRDLGAGAGMNGDTRRADVNDVFAPPQQEETGEAADIFGGRRAANEGPTAVA